MTREYFYNHLKFLLSDEEQQLLEAADVYNLFRIKELGIAEQQIKIVNKIDFGKYLFDMDFIVLKDNENQLFTGYAKEIMDLIKKSANDEFWNNFAYNHSKTTISEYYYQITNDKYIVIID